MMLARGLRTLALIIAAAGAVDPVFTLTERARQTLTITVLETRTLDLPDGRATRRERAAQVAARLRSDLEDSFDVELRRQPVQTEADPCPDGAACVVISDGARPRTLNERSGPLGAVRIGVALTPNVAVRRVASPQKVHPAATAVLNVDLQGRGVAGTTTEIEVTEDGVIVGQGSHTWAAAGDEAGTVATVQIPWTPVRSGVRDVRVAAITDAGETTTLDNSGHVAVQVEPRFGSVFIYEAQPTWSGTFIRRALEADGRFHVGVRSDLGAVFLASDPQLSLNERTLGLNVAVVVVTAPYLLSEPAIVLLEQFARKRGGSVVLLPDRRPEGRALRLFPGIRAERIETSPVNVGELMATEFITFNAPTIATQVLASAGADPVVVSRALGRGRIVVSGALDAWRFRDNNRFAAFWTSLVADALDAADDTPLRLSKTVVRPNEAVDIDVELRAIEPGDGGAEVRGWVLCGHGSPEQAPERWSLRLWPNGAPGRFRATFLAPDSEYVCRVEVESAQPATAALVVRNAGDEVLSDNDELTGAIAAHGGTVVSAGDTSALVTKLRASASPRRVSAQVYPLRSPWWILPFAACLAGEWWLRRRKGLR